MTTRYAYNLKPFGRQKSFYGKAIVVVTQDKYENTMRLRSYDTQVAAYDVSTQTFKIYGWYSVTTNKHVKSFLMEVLEAYSPSVWEAIAKAQKEWHIKSFKAFCYDEPDIKILDNHYVIIKAIGRPAVSHEIN